MADPDLRALCEQLVEALCGYDISREDCALVDCARAALAPPAPEPPTDEELKELSYKWFSRQNPWYYQDGCVAFARAVLARYGQGNG